MAEGGTGGKKRKQRRPKGLGVEDEKKVSRKKVRKDERRRKTGPRLPSALRKELGGVGGDPRNSDDESDVERKGDVYEYEEGVPEEEKGSNRRFDPVEDVEYELPEDFEVGFLLVFGGITKKVAHFMIFKF